MQMKETVKTDREYRKRKRETLKESKRIRKHTYSIQSRQVKQRMRKAYKKAEMFNEGKEPMVVKLKKLLNG